MSATLATDDLIADTGPSGRLNGRRLTLARVVWCVLASCAVLLFLLGIAPAFELLRMPCGPETCHRNLLSLRPAQMAALTGNGVAPELYAAAMIAVEALEAIVFVACGVLIFVRRSDDVMALITSLVLILIGAFMHPNTPHTATWTWPELEALDFTLYMVGNWLFPVLLFMIPDGRFVPRWGIWLWLTWGIYSTTAVIMTAQTSVYDPSSATILNTIGMSIMLLCLSVGVSGQVYRYRRMSTPQQRQQIKWLCLGLLGMLMGMLGGGLGITALAAEARLLGLRVLAALLNALGFACLPIALTFAILRYHLWDIDVVLNRALIYGALTAIIGTVYVLLVAGLGAIFHAQSNIAIAFVGAGFVALLFQPLHQRTQRTVNRLMYGQRDEPYAVLTRFGRRLESTPSIDTLAAAIVSTIKDTLNLPYVALAAPKLGIANSTAPATGISFLLTYQYETIGAIIVAPRDGEADLSSTDRRLLEDLARQAGVAVHAAGVTAELQRARERLVAAREEERRRLRRDLHDGLGPALAAIAAQSEAARDLIPTRSEVSIALLSDVIAQSQATTADIRRLVYDLRPPALDDLGLAGAIEAQAQALNQPGGLRISVQASAGLTLPAAVEVAAYRIALEALANVTRHAQATQCEVNISPEGDYLIVEVRDDGRGMPAHARAGVGLASMRERAEELGGVLEIDSAAGVGTTVRARLPACRLGEINS